MSSNSHTTDKNNNAAPSKPLNISHQNKFKYKRKWYYRDEWAMKCKNDKLFNNYILGTTVPLTNLNKSKSVNDLCHKDNKNKETTTTTTTNSIIIPEPSIPLLLLNYFIIYGYEEAAIRMCKELNLINNNNDIKQFNELFMIKERNKIKILIISGKITDAINLIDELFGLNILYDDTINNNNMVDENNNNNYNYSNSNSSSSSAAGGGGDNDDLYFQLILLNLIEMIRNNSYSNDIPKLVQYARTHLSTKASQSKKHMTDLQSVISLLMLTAASNNNNKEYVPLNINKLPSNLKMLYSIKLRNRLAHSINMKFLQIINIKVSNQNKFPNLILSGNLSLNSTDPINKIAHFQLHNHHDRHDDQLSNTTVESPVKMDLNPDQLPVTDHNRYWQETKKYLNLQNNTRASNSDNNIGWENFPFEAKLVQLMKLWIYSENRLHRKGFGIPRVEDNLKSS